MTASYDLNKLLLFAQENGLSLKIEFCEADGLLEVAVSSAAESECYAEKKTSVDGFIERWKAHVGRNP